MKRKFAVFFGLLVLVLGFLFGYKIIQKIQSEDLQTETIIFDDDGNKIEPVSEDETIYGG